MNPLVTPYRLKRALLRAFGAQVGQRVIIKPGVKVKYPWRLAIGENCWIGERVWLDNMENISIGANSVVSQGAYVCTGNHDWTDPGMGLTPRPVVIEEGAWIGASARVGPGCRIARASVIALGAVVTSDTDEYGVYAGNPALLVSRRVIRTTPGSALRTGSVELASDE